MAKLKMYFTVILRDIQRKEGFEKESLKFEQNLPALILEKTC